MSNSEIWVCSGSGECWHAREDCRQLQQANDVLERSREFIEFHDLEPCADCVPGEGTERDDEMPTSECPKPDCDETMPANKLARHLLECEK